MLIFYRLADTVKFCIQMIVYQYELVIKYLNW